jgi:hypothetical protein
MTVDEMRAILRDVTFEGYTFGVFQTSDGRPNYLQGSYPEGDISTGARTVQTTRKWYLSEHMTKSELVQTALLCSLVSAEHRVREHFRYRGKRIYGPHFDCDSLWEICKDQYLDYRRTNVPLAT